MKITIDKNDKTPVYLQIALAIRKQIMDGTLVHGRVLPSERKLAEKLGIHRNTVSKAYMELKADNYIIAEQGKYCRVNYEHSLNRNIKEKPVNWESIADNEYSDLSSTFDLLFATSFEEGLVSFAGGISAREVYPSSEIAENFRTIIADNVKQYFYVDIQGDTDLRKEFSMYLGEKGIAANPGEIQVFTENNQALSFLLDLLIEPDDKVLVSEVTSPDVYRTIELSKGRLISIPSDQDGMICGYLDQVIEKEKPKLIIIESGYENPTGVTLSLERRKRLLQLSYQYRIPIIEWDESSDLAFDGNLLPPIKALDAGNNVIYMYSFSLTMIPGIGISIVVADRKIVNMLCNMASHLVVNGDWAAQRVALEYMKDGKYGEKLKECRRVCMEKRDRMLTHLNPLRQKYGLFYEIPKGGVYLWVRLPGNLNARELLSCAQKRGVTFIPGFVFFAKQSRGRNYLRLNYSYPSLEEIDRGMEALTLAFMDLTEEI